MGRIPMPSFMKVPSMYATTISSLKTFSSFLLTNLTYKLLKKCDFYS